MTTHNLILRGLPQELTHTKTGTPRKRFPSILDLSGETISEVMSIRDKLVELYAPERARVPEADDVWVGHSSQASFLCGHRKWCQGRFGQFPVDAPHFIVNDRDSSRTEFTRKHGAEIIDNFKLSGDAWVKQMLGGQSMLTRWDRGTDPLTSLMIDVDHRGLNLGDSWKTVRLEIGTHVETLEIAMERLQSILGLEIPHQIMWTGNSGLWLHIHTMHAMESLQAARFVVMLAANWMPSWMENSDEQIGTYVSKHVCVDQDHLKTAELPLDGIFATKDSKKPKHHVSFDGGNLVTRPCRLPFAMHQKSHRPAVFVNTEGIIDDQIGYLIAIERSEIDLGAAVGGYWAERGYPAERETLPHIVTPVSVPEDGDASRREVLPHIVTYERPETEKHMVPGLRTEIPRGRWTVLVKDLRKAHAWNANHLPDEINDGDMNRVLIDERGLLWVYDVLSSHGMLTADNAVDMIMARYAGNERNKRSEVEARVRRGMEKGLHRLDGHRCVELAEKMAEENGVSDQLLVDLLVALTHRGRRDGMAYCILEDLARQISILEPMDEDGQRVAAAKKRVSRAVKRLEEIGLITRTRKGSPQHRTASAYRLEFVRSESLARTVTQDEEAVA